jgi:hypothetical protein
LPREKEADIFHKQISPLAMLASSPYFSSLHPEQQKQIAGYVSQMLSKQFPMGGANNSNQQQNIGMPQSPDMEGQNNDIQQTQGTSQGQSLVPQNAGEHFTGKFTQSPYTPGAAFRGQGGETIYAPTGTNVQKGQDVVRETKGLKKLFDQYMEIAPKVTGAGGFKRDISEIASGIQKTGLPFSEAISQRLGGGKIANIAANAQTLRSQMAPALRAIGFSNPEIEDIIGFHKGETEKNIRDRLKNAWPVIERKIREHKQNLQGGLTVNNQPENEEYPVLKTNSNTTKNPGFTLLKGPDGSTGFVPSDKASKLIASGDFKEVK